MVGWTQRGSARLNGVGERGRMCVCVFIGGEGVGKYGRRTTIKPGCVAGQRTELNADPDHVVGR